MIPLLDGDPDIEIDTLLHHFGQLLPQTMEKASWLLAKPAVRGGLVKLLPNLTKLLPSTPLRAQAQQRARQRRAVWEAMPLSQLWPRIVLYYGQGHGYVPATVAAVHPQKRSRSVGSLSLIGGASTPVWQVGAHATIRCASKCSMFCS